MKSLTVLLVLSVVGCGSGPSGDADMSPPPDLLISPFCTCATTSSCLRATVTRTGNTATQPWIAFAGQADGVGTLIVSATQGATVVSRKTYDNADVKPASASFMFDLGCIPTGMVTVRAFLDDNGDAMATETSSADYHDSCMLDRSPTATITAGAITTLTLPLNNSCD
jgi:hypothetical protein